MVCSLQDFIRLETQQRYLAPPPDDQSFGEDEDEDDEDDDDNADDHQSFSQINASSSPASTPPQPEFPGSPDLSEKINGPSASMTTTANPLRLLRSPDELEPTLSHRTSGSADDVEAELVPKSPSPSTNASQNPGSNPDQNQESRYPNLPPQATPVQTQSQFPSVGVNRFRRGTFQIRSHVETLRFGFGVGTPQSQGRPTSSQTLRSPDRSPDSSQVGASGSQSQANGDGTSWLNTQAFRPPESQDSYESDQ